MTKETYSFNFSGLYVFHLISDVTGKNMDNDKSLNLSKRKKVKKIEQSAGKKAKKYYWKRSGTRENKRNLVGNI